MKPRRKKSRKRSGASSTDERRLSDAVFYLDESIHSRVLVKELRAAGANVEHAGGAFPFGSADSLWLTGCGDRGWIVLMRDNRVRYRLLERIALEQAGVAAFVFTEGTATAADTAVTIVRLIRKMANMAISEPKPFLYSFGSSGHLNRVKVRKKRSTETRSA